MLAFFDECATAVKELFDDITEELLSPIETDTDFCHTDVDKKPTDPIAQAAPFADNQEDSCQKSKLSSKTRVDVMPPPETCFQVARSALSEPNDDAAVFVDTDTDASDTDDTDDTDEPSRKRACTGSLTTSLPPAVSFGGPAYTQVSEQHVRRHFRLREVLKERIHSDLVQHSLSQQAKRAPVDAFGGTCRFVAELLQKEREMARGTVSMQWSASAPSPAPCASTPSASPTTTVLGTKRHRQVGEEPTTSNCNPSIVNLKKKAPRKSCHQCKALRPLTELSFCATPPHVLIDAIQPRRCRKQYCDRCLDKYYSEGPATAKSWCCPACRGLCKCAACRRKAKALPDEVLVTTCACAVQCARFGI
ncbi:MAG: hypothetical protein MHM6MM_000483 [Cercozoa sp. M6MM]